MALGITSVGSPTQAAHGYRFARYRPYPDEVRVWYAVI